MWWQAVRRTAGTNVADQANWLLENFEQLAECFVDTILPLMKAETRLCQTYVPLSSSDFRREQLEATISLEALRSAVNLFGHNPEKPETVVRAWKQLEERTLSTPLDALLSSAVGCGLLPTKQGTIPFLEYLTTETLQEPISLATQSFISMLPGDRKLNLAAKGEFLTASWSKKETALEILALRGSTEQHRHDESDRHAAPCRAAQHIAFRHRTSNVGASRCRASSAACRVQVRTTKTTRSRPRSTLLDADIENMVEVAVGPDHRQA